MFFSYTHPWLNNQALFAFLSSILPTIFGIWGYYVFLGLTFFLNFVVSYRFFKQYNYASYYALIFSLSSYIWLHFGNHLDLMQIWLIPWVFSSMRNDLTYKSFSGLLSISTKILVAVLISNYLGFMIITAYTLYALYVLLQKKIGLKRLLLVVFMPTVFVTAVLLPYIKINYLSKSDTPVDFTKPLVLRRPVEDFETFSSRPWYFFIPHHNNPIYGDFSQKLVDKIEATGYFLADDYFAAEHGAAFYGYLLTSLFVFYLLIVILKFPAYYRRKVALYLVAMFLIFLISLPPFFTINEYTVYTPGYLVYKLFPMFRVTSRFSIMLLFLMLSVCAEITSFLYGHHKKFFKIFMPILLVVSLLETFVPPKIQKFNVPPEPIAYMSSKVPMSINFIVYPYSRASETFFWLPTHRQHQYNVRGYRFEDISSEDLTKNILSEDVLNKAREKGVEYLLVYDSDKNRKYFDRWPFQPVETFSSSILYIIDNGGLLSE